MNGEEGRARIAAVFVLLLALAGAIAGLAWSSAGGEPTAVPGSAAESGAVGEPLPVAHRRADAPSRDATRTAAPPGQARRRSVAAARRPTTSTRLRRLGVIHGAISPKSVVASPTGLFFAQNMMYRHSVTVYDRRRRLLATIDDRVDLRRLGIRNARRGAVRGAPVEAAFSPDGRYAYVSNYELSGQGYARPGNDVCSPASAIDDSVVYRIDVEKLRIDRAVRVGAVPKFLAVTPDGDRLLVANWCDYDLSVVDTARMRQVARLAIGPYPRGIAIDRRGTVAYVAVMGAGTVARVDLETLRVRRWADIGGGPRHLALGREGKLLFATLNADGAVVKIETGSGRVVGRVDTGREPRSAALSADGRSLYVVNYGSGTLVKLRTRDMKLLERLPAGTRPVGVTADAGSGQVWVADYAGALLVFGER